MIQSVFAEYGPGWIFYRGIYLLKIKMLTVLPITEKFFEKKVHVKQIDLFDMNIIGIKAFLDKISEAQKSEIISTADKAISGIIKGFSSIELDYGEPINWHYNSITKAEGRKNAKWYAIPDFNPKSGDIKVIWEASRLTHFYYFARAYLITGDEKYYQAFAAQLESWLLNNPYPYGENYKCGQECSLRMLSVLINFSIFKAAGLITDKDIRNIKTLIELCYKKVLSNFFYAHKCIKNNHTFSELCGLIVGAWCCGDELRLKKAYKLLDEEIRDQFSPDGGFMQYSFNYQRFTLQIIECVMKLTEKTGCQISETGRIRNSALLMYQMQSESGDLPNYGSNDGSLIFPVSPCGYRDFRPTINAIYSLIEGKRLYHHGDYDEELLWFGRGINLPLDKKMRSTVSFHESGFYILRRESSQLIVYLQQFTSRPAHMDQLHVDLWHKGVNILCDSGTYSYAGGLEAEYSLTSGHNTVKPENLEQMNKRGVFLVYDWTERKDISHDSNHFSGTMISKTGYEHTRTVSKTETGFMITDIVKGSGNKCSLLFHTPCKPIISQGGIELYMDEEKLCVINIDSSEIRVDKGYRSLYYLAKEEINTIIAEYEMKNFQCRMNTTINFFE